jgi:hypothetical protein
MGSRGVDSQREGASFSGRLAGVHGLRLDAFSLESEG